MLSTTFQLRPYQIESIKKIYHHWGNCRKRVMLQLPTGGGKTCIFGAIACDFTRRDEKVLVLKSVFVINRKIVNTALGRDVVEALSGYEIPVLKSAVCQRIVFAESAATGMTVLETDSKSAAASEIKALVDELMQIGE